jgi:hypothetical protein
MASRAAALRAELDRLDALVDVAEPALRARLLPRMVALREGVDLFDADLEAEAAGR